MIINTQDVESLIKSKVPALQISEETGLSTKGITNYRTGKAKLGNMTRGYLEKLQQFHNVHKDDKATGNIKIKGIRKAVSDFNNWQGAATVFYDKNKKEMWTNVYASGFDQTIYRDSNVVEIKSKSSLSYNWNTTTMRELKTLASASQNQIQGGGF